MFGLQADATGKGDKNKKPTDFLYDIEVEMKDSKKAKEINTKMTNRIEELKKLQRTGGANKEEFGLINLFLLGYEAVNKVLGRIDTKARK